jgi:methylmalonyl-CoA/ethylmalonyl-CoA epimerase
MKLGRLNHIGIATPSMDKSIAYYRDVMGATHITAPFDLPAQGVKVCFVDTPGENGTHGTQIELIEPLGADSPIHGFIAKNPAGGQHHMCYEVADIHEAKAWFEGKGTRVLGEPRIGAHGTLIFFVHPKDMNGVLTEIMETPKDGSGH